MENVQPAVIVKVYEADPPAHILCIDGQPRDVGHVVEEFAFQVVIQNWCVLAEVGQKEVEIAVAVVVSHRNAHVGLFLAIAIHRHASFQCTIGECSVMIVAEQEVGSGVTGHEQVGPAIIIIVKRNRG